MQGLPGSGKSTKAKELLTVGNTVRINKDLIRTMLHFDKFTGSNEAKTQLAAYTLAENFLLNNTSVIIDDTNLNPKVVESWKELAKKHDVKIAYQIMDTSIEECIARDELRDKHVGAHVIYKMALQYQEYLKYQNVIICDLDGTLCDIKHRLHFVKGEGKKDWKGFFEGIAGDSPRDDVIAKIDIELLRNEDCKVIFVSARPEAYRKETEKWMREHTPYGAENLILIMRQNGDSRVDTEVKSDIYDKYLKNTNIVKIFDDRPSVIRMWKEKGLPVEDVGSGVEF